MARPISNGLSYFPLDVDFYTDKKIRALKGHYGADGIMTYIILLCEIYRGKGYYVVADEDFIDCFSDTLGFSVEKTRQIISYLCGRSLFDNTLFTSVNVLTAKSVQQRYQHAKKGAKRDIEVADRLWLLPESDTLEFIKVRHFSEI